MASIIYHQKRSDAVVGLEDPLDGRAAAALERIGEEIAVDGRPIVSVSLRNIRSMTAAGISGLIRFHRRVRSKGGTVYFTGVRWELVEVFRLTGLDRMLNITPAPDFQGSDSSVVENRNPIHFLAAPRDPLPQGASRVSRKQAGERIHRRIYALAARYVGQTAIEG